MQNLLITLIIFANVTLSPNVARACDILNQDAVASAIDNLETYRPDAYQKILFLSDGPDFSQRTATGEIQQPKNPIMRWISGVFEGMGPKSQGEQVAAMYPNKKIVRTDLIISNPAEFGNQKTIQADNTEAFPTALASERFDFIVMRDGLCVCCTASACGGLRYERKIMGDFIKQVSGILNQNNPEAIAVLHARAGRINGKQLEILREAANDAQEIFPNLRFHINMVDGGRFHSLMIRPANAPVLSAGLYPP